MDKRIKRVVAAYFSPTGNAEMTAKTIADRVGKHLEAPVECFDFTLPEKRVDTISFAHNDLVVFCVPVYAGRIPNKILPVVQNMFVGNRTLVVPIVTFGNRNYDNALKELCFELDKKSFLIIGAAAFVSEHSFSSKLATGRPNEEDIMVMNDFADLIAEKINLTSQKPCKEICGSDIGQIKALDKCPLDVNNVFVDIDCIPGEWPLEKYYTPLGVDGKPAVFLKAKPKTNVDKCTKCGVCAAVCPMGSINKENSDMVDGVCIKCQACIKKCPEEAKFFDDEAFLSHVKMLENNYSRRGESSMFL